MAAALILADKSDVRRSRVRNKSGIMTDIHDRVNYAVERTELQVRREEKAVLLQMSIDTAICPVMDYFEIFLSRMLLCRKAADSLGLTFELVINQSECCKRKRQSTGAGRKWHKNREKWEFFQICLKNGIKRRTIYQYKQK